MRVSIRLKTVILLVFFALILSGTALSVSTSIINRIIDVDYSKRADELAATMALSLDGDRAMALRKDTIAVYDSLDKSQRVGSECWGSPEFDAYISNFEEVAASENAHVLMEQLKRLQAVNDVDCMYLLWIIPEDEICVYLVDAAEEDACPTGNYDPVYSFNEESLTDPERGFPAYTTNTEEYGWLVSAAAPIHDSNGEIAAYATLDISMDAIREEQLKYVLLNGSLLLGLTVLLVVSGILLVDRYVIRPLRLLSTAAKNYCLDTKNSIHHGFESLPLRNRDEIGDLYESMKQMESDINDYYTTLFAAKQEIIATREEADRMNELASADSLTGVRNKRSYEVEAKKLDNQLKKKELEFAIGIVDMNNLKKINDRYGHEMGDLAIKKICSVVCETFVHSPVFRYGGDEFVIILRDRDLLHAEELRNSFLKELEELSENSELKPWERLSAAIGIAKFLPGCDHCVEDVFRRADEEMYHAKKEMKAGRNS